MFIWLKLLVTIEIIATLLTNRLLSSSEIKQLNQLFQLGQDENLLTVPVDLITVKKGVD